ncbi:hypothetical protein [Actinomadura macrotermitis]|uniref:Uncharacterized protein n=1 Tax=Actinomadura macrotermitis TaxID=2585200 RepID=A0A7K0C4Y6_9ACTN|nr:hypothetical protein [Actinomadura macrotermitis]MQY08495.1 hypothetical protein [Actinomadura macrotermitis]
MTTIEERIRAALAAEAARVEPHGHARADNLARLARARRRRRWAPALAAAATASVLALAAAVLVVVQPEQRAPRPAASLLRDLDPRYRPTGPVWRPDRDTSVWIAGNLLCWRAATGGGDCRPWRIPGGQHAAVIMERSTGQSDGQEPGSVLYGVADGRVTDLRPTGRLTGAPIRIGGGTPRIWQVPLSPSQRNGHGPASLSVMAGPNTAVLLPVLQAVSPPHLDELTPEGWTRQFPPVGTLTLSQPRPLTTGTPLFTFPARHGPVTMHLFRDGAVVGFGTEESVASGPGAGRNFGAVYRLVEGPRSRWWYGFAAPRMTRVVAELRDGRKLPARMVDLGGGGRVFSVHATGLARGATTNRIGRLAGYDAQGRLVNVWAV